MKRVLGSGSWVLGLLVASFATLAGQQEAPFSYAITGARIVPVSSAPIENGTVVFSAGVITAIGGDIPVPPGAITIAGQ